MSGDWKNSFQVRDSFRERTTATSGDDDGEPCGRGDFCAEASRVIGEDGKAYRVPVRGPVAFCVTDTAIIERCIVNVPKVHGVLAKFLGVKVTAEQVVRVPFGPSVPIRLDVDEIARLMADAVFAWHQRVAAVVPGMAAVPGWHPDALPLHAGKGCCPACGTRVLRGGARWNGRPVHADCAQWLERDREAPDLDRSCKVLAARLSSLLSLDMAWQVRPSRSPAALCAYGANVAAEYGNEQTLAMAGGAQAGNEFLRLDYLARAAIGITPAPVTVLLGMSCANERCDGGTRSLRLADPPQHEGDTVYYSQCTRCRHLLTETEYEMWADQNARWWKRRLTPAQVASRSCGQVSEGQAARLLAAVAGPGAA